MPEQMPPSSRNEAPDPSFNYERSHPEREPGMGDLDAHMNTPTNDPDRMEQAVKQRQDVRQLNGEETVDERSANAPAQAQQGLPPQPDHSMLEEEPTDWDLAPTDIHDPRQKRHPRVGGKGGTPDAGEPTRNG